MIALLSTSNAKLETLHPKAIQYAPFEETNNGARFTHGIVQSLTGYTKNGCALACNRLSICRSFNFRNRATCELNSDDTFSVENAQTFLTEVSNSEYTEMKKNSRPLCQENGLLVDIKNDDVTRVCRINEKRVDGQWGLWSFDYNEDEPSNWKEFHRRQRLIEPAHGGIGGETNELKVVSWFKWVKTPKNFRDAKDYCIQKGGKLFSQVDGTKNQLDFFHQKLGETHWLGIYTTDHKIWRDIDGEAIGDQRLVWANEQPNNKGGKQYGVVNLLKSDRVYLGDVQYSGQYFSVCDMVV